MRKHGFRSIFSLLLALMMVCSLLPTAAFAEGNLEPTDQVTEQPTDQPAGGEVQQPTEKKEDAPQGEQPATPPQTYAVVYADGAENTVFEAKSFPGLTSGEVLASLAGFALVYGLLAVVWLRLVLRLARAPLDTDSVAEPRTELTAVY